MAERSFRIGASAARASWSLWQLGPAPAGAASRHTGSGASAADLMTSTLRVRDGTEPISFRWRKQVVSVNRMASLCPADDGPPEGGTAVVVRARVVNPQAYASGDDRATRSAEVLQKPVPSQGSPGCAAAVGVRGSFVGEAGRGITDLTTGRAITSKTVFGMASNSRQFTADAVLLLAGRHKLALNDPLSDYLDNPPVWARDVTLGDLMRHTSGIPDYQDLLEAKGIELTDPAGQEEAIAAILGSQPQDPPGEGFSNSYSNSNSNYVLLAHVVERVTSKPFPTFIQQEFFTLLDLRMTVSTAVAAGILLLSDQSVVHRGDWEGFHSTFKVSPDRNTAVTVVCNADPPDNFRAANQLLDIWTK
ncbi:serine hydrolase domain-containing protein [Streptomyces sp. NPDC057301]|uniref:serine hydrolase domain-containing protein n=1 Tax=Streptomyces sp. NPDC057301 TaxID=3346093 RepID=UPI003630FCC2